MRHCNGHIHSSLVSVQSLYFPLVSCSYADEPLPLLMASSTSVCTFGVRVCKLVWFIFFVHF